MIRQFVRGEQRDERLRETSKMLRNVDQRHGEIARRAKHRYTQRAHQNDVADGRLMALPETDRPSKQTQN